uniref:Uncharacterized protein n=1 Tax=uncultured bacterium A1Q1_fos_2101 TaxID=1256561 RepID=L7VU77_9BACT|nr:hypothetical protein [uncultured bacterium A1Q1_fos_2101]
MNDLITLLAGTLVFSAIAFGAAVFAVFLIAAANRTRWGRRVLQWLDIVDDNGSLTVIVIEQEAES